jgi:phosphoribosyl 1,2-cyclic phosphodiesterase
VIRLRFWGTRGSTVAPGAYTERYGGNTPCVEVIGYDGCEPGAAARLDNHRLILDAGIGLVPLQDELVSGPWGVGQGDLAFLLSHLHWDHIQGLPFFVPAFVRGNRLTFYAQNAEAVQESIERLFASVYSPIEESLLAQLICRSVIPAGMDIEGFRVQSAPNQHPGGALSFRVSHDKEAVVYTTDHECGDSDVDTALVRLAQGADLWILDAAYTEQERAHHRDYGHSSYAEAVEMAARAGVRTAVLFHHDYEHGTGGSRVGGGQRDPSSSRPGWFGDRTGRFVGLDGGERPWIGLDGKRE